MSHLYNLKFFLEFLQWNVPFLQILRKMVITPVQESRAYAPQPASPSSYSLFDKNTLLLP